jgi:hypothetical protein
MEGNLFNSVEAFPIYSQPLNFISSISAGLIFFRNPDFVLVFAFTLFLFLFNEIFPNPVPGIYLSSVLF